jgi:aspartate kinase
MIAGAVRKNSHEIRMSLVVMKFGGTSVEDPAAIGRTAAIVAGRVAQGKQPVVVVSAMAKVTDQLLRAAAAPRGRPHRRAGHQFAPALAPSRHRRRPGQRTRRLRR